MGKQEAVKRRKCVATSKRTICRKSCKQRGGKGTAYEDVDDVQRRLVGQVGK